MMWACCNVECSQIACTLNVKFLRNEEQHCLPLSLVDDFTCVHSENALLSHILSTLLSSTSVLFSCTPLGIDIDSSSRVVDHISTIIPISHFHWKCLTCSCDASTCSVSKVHAVQYDYNLNSVCMCENINTLLLYLFNNAKYYM